MLLFGPTLGAIAADLGLIGGIGATIASNESSVVDFPNDKVADPGNAGTQPNSDVASNFPQICRNFQKIGRACWYQCPDGTLGWLDLEDDCGGEKCRGSAAKSELRPF